MISIRKSMLDKLPIELMDNIWSFLHPNQKRYYERDFLDGYDDLSEDQLLQIPYIPICKQPLLILQCIKIESFRPLLNIQWSNVLINTFVTCVSKHHFSKRMMDFVMRVIDRYEPKTPKDQLDFNNIFNNYCVTCKASYDWYREHNLWHLDALECAIRNDDPEWYASVATTQDFSRLLKHSCTRILCSLPSLCMEHVQELFSNFRKIESLQTLYDAMHLTTSHPFHLTTNLEIARMRFLLDHFLISVDVWVLMHSKLFACHALLSMYFAQPIDPEWDFATQANEMTIDELKRLYIYAPDVFRVDITTGRWDIEKFRFVMNHGSFVTRCVIDVEITGTLTTADYKLDERLDFDVVETTMTRCLFNLRELHWLAYTMLKLLPANDPRFNRLLYCDGYHRWFEFLPEVALKTDWSSVMLYDVLMVIETHIKYVVKFIDVDLAFESCLVHQKKPLFQLCELHRQKVICLNVDATLIAKMWTKVKPDYRYCLFRTFPEICEHLPITDPNLAMLRRKRRRLCIQEPLAP